MDIDESVNHGIIFLRFDGNFDNTIFNKFNAEIDYLLYKQGISYYTFSFYNVSDIEESLISKIQNKLIEILLSCGKVVMCGLSLKIQNKIGFDKNSLYYVNSEREAFNLLSL